MFYIHHATAAKAAKLGFTFTQIEGEDSAVLISWNERNKRFTHNNGPQAVEDMSVLRMLTLEYPKLRVVPLLLETGMSWTIYKGTTKIGAAVTLKAAWDQALDVLEGPAPAKPVKTKRAPRDEDADEDGGNGEETEEQELSDAELGLEDEEEGEEGGKSVVKRVYKQRYRPFRAKCGDELSVLITTHLTAGKDEDGRVRLDEERIERFARANGVWVDSYALLNVGMRRMNIANRLRAMVKKGYEIVWAK